MDSIFTNKKCLNFKTPIILFQTKVTALFNQESKKLSFDWSLLC